MSERWLPIVGYEGFYEVSDQGRVRSLDRVVPCGTRKMRTYRGRALADSADTAGYRIVALYRDGRRRTTKVHSLVLESFVGSRPAGMEACHNNGDLADNRLANLRWDTHSRNVYDSVRQGTHPQSRKTRCTQGHLYTRENTYIQRSANGKVGRVCRTCQREWQRQYQLRKAVNR